MNPQFVLIFRIIFNQIRHLRRFIRAHVIHTALFMLMVVAFNRATHRSNHPTSSKAQWLNASFDWPDSLVYPQKSVPFPGWDPGVPTKIKPGRINVDSLVLFRFYIFKNLTSRQTRLHIIGIANHTHYRGINLPTLELMLLEQSKLDVTLYSPLNTDKTYFTHNEMSRDWMEANWHCHWTPVAVDIEIPTSMVKRVIANQRNLYLRISGQNFKQAKMIKAPEIIYSFMGDPEKVNLAVCVQNPLYFFTDWSVIIQAFELWKAQGIELVVVGIAQATEQVLKVLDVYVQQGLVILIQNWGAMPYRLTKDGVDPLAHIIDYAEEAFNQACLHLLKGRAKFVLHIDLDEVVMAKRYLREDHHHNVALIDYLEELMRMYPNAAAFHMERPTAIHSANLNIQKNNKYFAPNEINFDHLMDTKIQPKQQWSQAVGKNVVLPERVKTLGIHWVYDTYESYDKMVFVDYNDMAIYHFREAQMFETRLRPVIVYNDKHVQTLVHLANIGYQQFLTRVGHNFATSKMALDTTFSSKVTECEQRLRKYDRCTTHQCFYEMIHLQNEYKDWVLQNMSHVIVF